MRYVWLYLLAQADHDVRLLTVDSCSLQLNNMPVELSRVFIYPRMFALHNMPPEVGLPAAEDETAEGASANSIVLPPVINLSIERLQCDGVFLLDDTLSLYLWVGRSAPPELLESLFGIPSMEGVDCNQVRRDSQWDSFD